MRMRSLHGGGRLFCAAVVLFACTCAAADGEAGCRVERHDQRLELRSPLFAFVLDTSDGLRAASWEHRIAGRTIGLGRGAELAADFGPPGGPLETPHFRVSAVEDSGSATAGEALVALVADAPAITARIAYGWSARDPVLKKNIEITNGGARELMLLNVRLGTYTTAASLVDRDRAASLRGPPHRGGSRGSVAIPSGCKAYFLPASR